MHTYNEFNAVKFAMRGIENDHMVQKKGKTTETKYPYLLYDIQNATM